MYAIRGVAAAVGAVVALAGCTNGAGGNKAGGPDEPRVLRLATIDEVNDNGQSFGPQAFVDNLQTLSGGRLKVEVVTEYGGGSAEAESNLIRAIASGEIDGGWPATRGFDGAGISGLQVVEAPMTISSYEAEKALVSGPIAAALLAKLDGTGVVGLGLAVGPLRRPFAARAPMVGPADWSGKSFRVYNSPVQADAVRALGATPVNLGFAGVTDELRVGRLDGIELDIAQYEHNGSTAEAGHVTANVVLWPKVFVLSVARKTFDSLTEQQRAWVREAAGQAVQASVDATYDETTPAQQLCARGVRFANASDDDIRGLRAKLRPVLNRLAADPNSGPLLAQIQALAAAHPGPGDPHPGSCSTNAVPAGVPGEVSAIPAGVYRVEITTQEVRAAGLDNRDGTSGTWTLTIRDGTYEVRCRPIHDPGIDCGHSTYDGPLEAGDLRGAGHTVFFVPSAERMSRLTGCVLPASSSGAGGHCQAADPWSVTWAVTGASLKFTDDARSSGSELFLKPWRKIA